MNNKIKYLLSCNSIIDFNSQINKLLTFDWNIKEGDFISRGKFISRLYFMWDDY